jgi:phosphoglycerol transferase MdoB-like AlkP superfamily enzyme
MKRFKENFPNIASILYVYLLGLALFFAFRLTLFLTEIDRIGEIPDPEKWPNILGAFWMGIRFDTVISGYILLFPFVLISVGLFFRKIPFVFYRIVFWIVFLAYALAFLLCAIDIPFFGQFFSRLTVVALEWMNTPGFVFKMIIQEPTYWLYIIPFTVICILFYYISKKIFLNLRDRHLVFNSLKSLVFKIIVTLLFAGLIFVGIRGRITKKSPIRVGTAYFSNYAFINKLGLNPVFTFLRSALDESDESNKKLNLMDPVMALELVKHEFNAISDSSASPIDRMRGNVNDSILKKNVVIVLMESMTSRKLSLLGNKDYHTPCLDSLANNGYFFTNIYSSGIHTFNGIYSTVFGYPALLRQHPMQAVEIKKYKGISSVLKNYGYFNIYVTTYDGQFDNAEGFMMANDFDQVISQKNYPSEMVKSTLGVPDDYMFEFAVPIMTEAYKRQGNFLCVLTTTSDHGPYVIPEYFKPNAGDIKHQIVEYADWSISKFIKLASKEKWFNNTVFVFIADHGEPIEAVYDMPLNYHHIPLIIYSPGFLKPAKFEQFGGQIDVFPTLIGILKMPYHNNTLGIDLINENRPYIYFSADDRIGVINDEYFLIIRNDKSQGLYKYRLNDHTDYSTTDSIRVKKMKDYAFSNMQTAQWMIDNDK